MHFMMSNKSPTTSSTASPPLLDGKALKKEIPDDENIKDFAETAMNELLGWYGYDARGSRTASMKAGPPGSKSPTNHGTQPPNKSPSAEENDVCAWCNNPITNDSNPLHQSMGEKFCSEICFSQSRRANFKRAKTCDWCRHIRHTVSYVDFQDGATQLQFCSDKCLNQYKMHIFCRETQAHLDLNPHLVNAATSNTNLITPELWLKNCRSRSVSPSSEHSISPNNADKVSTDDAPQSPKSILNSSTEIPPTNTTQSNIKSTHPIITVAPTSKLMKTKPTLDEKLKIQNASEMRREHKILKVYSKRRRSSRCSSTVTSQNYLKHNNNNLPSIIKPQDLTIRSPSLSQDSSPNSSILHTPQSIIPSPPLPMNSRITNMHPINFPNPMLNLPTPHPPTGSNTFPNQRSFRPPFYPQHNYNFPRPPSSLPNEQIRNAIPPPFQLGIGPPPPMTVLVPYPVILPLPLPIPIPIPVMNFAKAYENNKWPNEEKTDSKRTPENSTHDPVDTFSEEPIDFTMTNKRRCNNNTDTENKNEKQEDIVIANEINDNEPNNDSESIVQSGFSGHLDTVDSGNPEQTLPRFKITRLGAKMSKIVLPKTKEVSESTRPLRKRRRLVDVPAEEECSSVTNKTRKTVHA